MYIQSIQVPILLVCLVAPAQSANNIRSINIQGVDYDILISETLKDAAIGGVRDTLVQIIGDSAVTLVQGSTNKTVLDTLLSSLWSKYPDIDWQCHTSPFKQNSPEDVGELLGVFYRPDIMDISDLRTWTDSPALQRYPIYGRVYCASCELEDFILVNLHVNSSQVAYELDEIPNFVNSLAEELNDTNILIGGDLSAGVPWTTPEVINTLALTYLEGYHWIAGHNVDSGASLDNNGSAYRFLACSDDIANAVLNGSVRDIDVVQDYGLNQLEALEVSALKPIEIVLS